MKHWILLSLIFCLFPITLFAQDPSRAITDETLFAFFKDRMDDLNNGRIEFDSDSNVSITQHETNKDKNTVEEYESKKPKTRITFFQQDCILTETFTHPTSYMMVNQKAIIRYSPRSLPTNSPARAMLIERGENFRRDELPFFKHEAIVHHWEHLNIEHFEIIDENNFQLSLIPKDDFQPTYNEIHVSIQNGEIRQIEFISGISNITTYTYSEYQPVEHYPYKLPHKITVDKQKTDTQAIQHQKTIQITQYDLNRDITAQDCMVSIPEDVQVIQMSDLN